MHDLLCVPNISVSIALKDSSVDLGAFRSCLFWWLARIFLSDIFYREYPQYHPFHTVFLLTFISCLQGLDAHVNHFPCGACHFKDRCLVTMGNRTHRTNYFHDVICIAAKPGEVIRNFHTRPDKPEIRCDWLKARNKLYSQLCNFIL